MNGTTDSDMGNESERAIAELFSEATPRKRPPAEVEAEVRAVVYEEWRSVSSRRRTRRRLIGLAAAASVMLGLALSVSLLRPPPPAAERVATLSLVRSELGVRAVTADAVTWWKKPGQVVVGGTTLELPGDGGAVLDLADGGQLRAVADTRVTLLARREFELLAGALYFDSGAERTHATTHIRIRARGTTVRDIGTRFAVDLRGGALEVKVRTGAVEIDRDGDIIGAGAGERLRVTETGAVERSAVPAFGRSWDWVDELAYFDADAVSLSDALAWIARETGRSLHFETAAVRRAAEDPKSALFGLPADPSPATVLLAIEKTTDFDIDIDGGVIVLRLTEGTDY